MPKVAAAKGETIDSEKELRKPYWAGRERQVVQVTDRVLTGSTAWVLRRVEYRLSASRRLG